MITNTFLSLIQWFGFPDLVPIPNRAQASATFLFLAQSTTQGSRQCSTLLHWYSFKTNANKCSYYTTPSSISDKLLWLVTAGAQFKKSERCTDGSELHDALNRQVTNNQRQGEKPEALHSWCFPKAHFIKCTIFSPCLKLRKVCKA